MFESQTVLPVVDFYVLSTHLQQQRLDFACKLIEKIYRSGQNCYVLVDTLEQAADMDKQLWSFRAGSFIPHQLFKDILPELPQTILIGLADIPESRQNLIVNLSSQLPKHGPQTGRILEVLDNSESCKQAGRERYRYYRQLGINPVTHKLS